MTKKYSPRFLPHSIFRGKKLSIAGNYELEKYTRDVGNTPLSKKVTLPTIKKLIK